MPVTDIGKTAIYSASQVPLQLQTERTEERMSDLQTRFEQAQQNVSQLPGRPANDILLKLYALYKQGTQGDVSGEQPGSFDFVRRAKYDAWSAVKGTTKADAMQQYVKLVDSLRR